MRALVRPNDLCRPEMEMALSMEQKVHLFQKVVKLKKYLDGVMTAPPVIPAAAAGLPQIVPMIRAPELTGAMADGTVRLELRV